MANIIITYGSASIPIEENPLVDGAINPLFEAKLEEIEPTAFTTSIVSGNIRINYEGVEIVQIKHNGNFLATI